MIAAGADEHEPAARITNALKKPQVEHGDERTDEKWTLGAIPCDNLGRRYQCGAATEGSEVMTPGPSFWCGLAIVLKTRPEGQLPHRDGLLRKARSEALGYNYPKAQHIRVVLDNLSTHSAGALYQAFPPEEARRILRRVELHHVPKHASWLNMVEIEIGVLKGQCLDRRIAERATLEREIATWEAQRNASGAKVRWMFTVERAREKMGHAYPEQKEPVAMAAAA